ncbi:MAG: MOSC domain-containing protein [Xanthobacteraceae bacterium]
MAKIQSIYRYPVKGLTPEPLARTRLQAGQTVPGDRLYAIENGPSGFDPAAPSYLSKTHFLMLMKNERLATLHASFDQDSHTLIVAYPSPQGRSEISADLRTTAGRTKIESFFAAYCADELRGPPKILHGAGHSFSDVAKKVVSIINLASVAAVEDMVGAPVNPLRFRANVYVEGWPAWNELDLVGRALKIGGAQLKVVKRIVRCAATNVDPDTGARDLNIPQTLLHTLDHADCGIYAEVMEGGEIAAGDEVQLA